MKILWLIDNPVYTYAHKHYLERNGHACTLARTCKEGQGLIDNNAYDLVLLNIGTSAGRRSGPEYTEDTPAVRTFYQINKSKIKKYIFLSFTPDRDDEIDLWRLADVKVFLEFITTECREG